MPEWPALLRLRFEPQAEAGFRGWLRRRLVVPRVAMFLVMGLGFLFAPFFNSVLFGFPQELHPLFVRFECGVVFPAALLAALCTGLRVPSPLPQAAQTAAVIAVCLGVLAVRYLALDSGAAYPAQMIGIVLIAVALIGGFSWRRMALATVLFSGSAIVLEFWMGTPASAPAAQAYSLIFMAIIALLGAYSQEFLRRIAWLDMRQLQRAQSALNSSERRFDAFMRNSPAISWIKDEAGVYQYASESFLRFVGLGADGWRGRTDFDFFPADFAQRSRELDQQVLVSGQPAETRGPAQDASGAMRHWMLVRFPFTDPSGQGFLGGIATDVTERTRMEQEVRLQSLTDEMTGLYNRRGLRLLLEHELKRARRLRARCAIVYVDLDGLKAINTAHGHAGGDQAITAVGEALRVAVRASDLVARVGGDEFVVFTIGSDVAHLCERILSCVEDYNRTRALPFTLAVTIGTAEVAADEDLRIESLISQADVQMMATKRQRAAA